MNLGPKIYGNFRTRGVKPKKEKLPTKKRPGMSEAHLAAIRKLPCVVTGRVPAGEAHHLKVPGERGTAMKATDKWAVPLCHTIHMDLESVGSKNEPKWFRKHGIDDPYALADALWHASPDVARMTRIVIEHRGKP